MAPSRHQTAGVAPIRVVRDAKQAGRLVARRIVSLADSASAAGRRVVLGLPAGRTPRPLYARLSELAAKGVFDPSRLEIVMMDEFLVQASSGLDYCDPNALHGCRRYAEHEIRGVLNAGVVAPRRLAAERVHFPDPRDPAAYEDLIGVLGGIDLFVLAAGASDGHVAFNPPGTPLESRTRIVALAEATRRDNLSTFPSLERLTDVPTHGVTVGLGTIVENARAVVLLLLGTAKRACARRTLATGGFDPTWPASVVHACRDAEIVLDEDAAGERAGA